MAAGQPPDAVDLLDELSQLAAHRGSGTANERKTAQWIARKLRGMGYEVAEQPFRTTRDNLYLIPAQLFGCAVAATALALFTSISWLGIVLLAYGVAVLLAETSGYSLDLTLMPRFASQNVFTEPARKADRTVFVTGHYDTQRGSFLFHPKFVDRLPVFFNICYGAVFLAILGVGMRFAGVAAAGYFLWPALGLCSCALGTYLAAEISGRYTPGANDNGTGVAMALWLASEYSTRRDEFPADCDLRFLFTGSEETGERGMRAFLSSHNRNLDSRRVRFVNLDNLGSGMLTYLSGEGMVFYRRAGATLLSIARSMREEMNASGCGRKVLEQANLLLPTDALPPLALGFEAISFLGKDEAGRLGHYHWHTDTVDNVDTEFLGFQQAFFREYAQRAMAAEERR
jgi:hypothetical protein